jgi:hypothetical protein
MLDVDAEMMIAAAIAAVVEVALSSAAAVEVVVESALEMLLEDLERFGYSTCLMRTS